MIATKKALNYFRARNDWRNNGRTIARLKSWRARRGLGADPELDDLAVEWGHQGRALFFNEPDNATGLGFLWLIPVIGGAATLIYGTSAAKKALEVKRLQAQRYEEVLKMIDAGEITASQGERLLKEGSAATEGKPILQQILGVSPLVLLTIAGAYVFRGDIAKLLKRKK